ncbi:stage II sporulation protein R [Cohnella terricola]|uniref:Stage II sporulation protein R n=1 Tax=Cohnella terricola TaxID=1289167 RepID=A0A559JB71_9BACL|nr:stage II sporulation protein R [Cohnella terricola]TVX97130.1 stage II sporulation protein R [Cohnella terricola]
MRKSHHFFYFSIKAIVGMIVIGLVVSAFIGKFASASSGKLIPDDAIRIRILANSDAKADQAIKNKVRGAVAAYIESWGAMPSTHDEAFDLIEGHLPEIGRLVNDELDRLGASYGGKVELAKVPFPEKEFDSESYSAGDYEALRITLGKGAGANWWCVLFPPLCLTAAVAKDDKPAVAGATQNKAQTGVKQASAGTAGEEPKAKFFLVELFQKLFAFLRSLFS